MKGFFSKIQFFIRSKVSVYVDYPELLLSPHKKILSDRDHLDLAIDWIKNAAGCAENGGVPAFYDLLQKKWGQSYRETTGYIIPTLLNYHKISSREDFLILAKNLGDWEIKNQTVEGAIGEPKKDGTLNLKTFNTGQVILGLCALYDNTKERKYIEAAKKASDWLLSHQSASGEWDKFSNDGANCIDTRVAWALLEVWRRDKNEKYKISAVKFLNWAIAQQQPNGWFKNSSLRDPKKPWTHTIVYTISGILESALLLDDQKLFSSAYKGATAILDYYKKMRSNGYLPGSFDQNWGSTDKYSCLTGNAQISIEWFKIYDKTGEEGFLIAAEKMIEQLKKLQFMNIKNPTINGGMGGSHPISGNYATFIIPNWGVKFFADALMHKMRRLGTLLG